LVKSSTWPPSAKARSVPAATMRSASAEGGAPVAIAVSTVRSAASPVPDRGPALEPARQDGKLGAAREGGAFSARRFAGAIGRDAAHAME